MDPGGKKAELQRVGEVFAGVVEGDELIKKKHV